MVRIQKLFAVLALAATMGVLGTAGGLTVRSALAQQEEVSPGPGTCPDDECEGGTTCRDNPGGGTLCNYEGSICRTRAC